MTGGSVPTMRIRGAIFTVILVAGCSSTTLKSDAGQEVSDARSQAANVCEKFVKARLKSPGSAKFRDPYGDQITYTGDGKGPITVTASVDSQNSFGASLRSPYTCTVTKASGSTWNLVKLDLQEASG